MKNFKKLLIWQKAMDIIVLTYNITAKFPDYEKFGLSSQCQRSAVSIASNIAEGSSRASTKDQKRFMEIGLGSLFELETQLLIATRLGYINNVNVGEILEIIDAEQKMLTSFIKVLKMHYFSNKKKFD